MVGRGLDQGAEVGQRAAVVAVGVLRVAQPEQRRRPVAALREALDELGHGRLRTREVGLAEQGQGRFELALLARVGDELAPVDGDLHRLDAAQAVFHRDRHVLLQALQLGEVARHLLVLPAQAGHFAAQLLDLLLQVEQAAAQLAVLLGGAQFQDGLARLVVGEELGLAGQRRQQCRHRQRPREGGGAHHR